MKKLILMMSFVLIGLLGFSQSVQLYTFTADTLTDADVAYCAAPVLYADWNWNYVITADELTGSATLICSMEVSNDNTTWATDPAFTPDTLEVDGVFTYHGKAYAKYYRFVVTQTGTATASIFGSLTIKKSIVKTQ